MLRVPSIVALVLALAIAPAARASQTADRCDSEVVSRWADLIYETIQTMRMFPPQTSRVVGYFGVTVNEAAAPGRSRGASLAGRLNGLASVPQPDPAQEHEWRAVVNAAAARLLTGLFAGAPSTLAGVEALRARIHSELASEVPAAVLARSELQGVRVADAILAWAKTDGHAQLAGCAWKPPKGSGLWEPTPLDLRPALEPCWGQLRPLMLPAGSACEPPPPTPCSTDPASQFMKEVREVKDAVDRLTPEQQQIALYWSDDRSVTGGPPGHWMALVAQLSRERGLPLGVACEAHARVGIAVADAFISCWEAKYRFDFVRPVTVIQREIDPAWLPLLPTPPFPEYTSGHSVQSAAAAAALTEMFGTMAFTDRVLQRRGLAPRSFASFGDAAREAAISRLYGGIHFRPSIENGLLQGACVARSLTDEGALASCAAGDVYPQGQGDGKVTLADYLLARRQASGSVTADEQDRTCGDVAPGTWTGAASEPSRGWRPEGDGRFGADDALTIGLLASGAARIAWMAAEQGDAGAAPTAGAERVVRVAAGTARERAAFSFTVRGLPPDASLVRVEASSCADDEIAASRLADGAWTLTCAPDAPGQAPAGVVATLRYRSAKAPQGRPAIVSEAIDAGMRAAAAELRVK